MQISGGDIAGDVRADLDDNGLDGNAAKVQILTNRDTGLRTVRIQVSAEDIGEDAETTATTTTTAATTTS